MNLVSLLVKQKRLILTTAILLAIAGVNAWFNMKRQEDPFFPYRNGFVLTQYPGATVEDIENLVLRPLEEEISQVEEVSEITGIARAGFCQIIVRMKEHIYDTDTAWNNIRDAIERAQADFPDGVFEPVIDDNIVETPLMVYAISGNNDVMHMRWVAEELKNQLLTIPEISQIKFYGKPDEEISVEPDMALLKSLDINPNYLASQISDKTELVPLGALQSDSRQVLLNAQTSYQSIKDIQKTLITLPDDSSLPLDTLAKVSYGAKQDASSVFWLDGQRAVGIGLFVPVNQLNVVKFGGIIEQKMKDLNDKYPNVNISPVFFQPDRVSARINELGQSLMMGMLLVTVVLTIFLGLRPGLVVASVIPLVTFTALAVYDFSGQVLHQMAISGMVIALGMLVDNAIVMVENIQYHIDQGKRKSEASILAVKQLAFSLFSATGTTLAAFIPMLMAKGNTGDFTNAIPVVIMLSITISYIYCIFVTPAFSHIFLTPSNRSQQSRIMTMGKQFGHVATKYPKSVLFIAMVFISLSMGLFTVVKKDFFPSTDRNQLIVDVAFAEGTHLKHNNAVAKALSLEILKQPQVKHSYVFSGNSGPKFYYNLSEKPRSPNISQIDVELTDAIYIDELIEWINDHVKSSYPNVEIIAKKLGQGPPVTAPIEIKVFADDRQLLGDTVQKIQQVVEKITGTRDVRNDLGIGLPSYQFSFKDEMLNRYGISREQVAQLIGLSTGGLVVGQYRRSQDPIDIRVRGQEGINFPLSQLRNIELQLQGQSIPVHKLVDIELAWLPASIHHYGLQRTASVFSEIRQGTTYNAVLNDLQPVLDDLILDKNVSIQVTGTNKESKSANKSLGAALPIGMILLLMFLLIEFNSFTKVIIILMTIPLAFAGVPFGLLLTNTTFGFTAILGVLALIGIVVNNAIVLLDLIQKNLDKDMAFDKAVVLAVQRRARPILLTTITTVAGLFPLVITKSTLWPPLAWTIISGLLFSTFMSLLVVPAMYRLLLKRKERRSHRQIN